MSHNLKQEIMKSVSEVLKEVKKEFKEQKNEGSVIYNNFITGYFGYPDASNLHATEKAAREVISQLGNTRGIYAVITEESFASVNGAGCKVPTCVRLIRKPCKEFLQLCNYLTKYTNSKLGLTDVKRQYVKGKRSYYDVESEILLAHNAKKCSAILSWLRSNRATTYDVALDIQSYKDRTRGYEEETEWAGTYDYSLAITLYQKKSGKVKAKAEFFAW